MPDKILPAERNAADEKLAAALSHSLDKSLDDIDEVSLQRLKHVRVQALGTASKSSRTLLRLGIAASVAALLLIPVVSQQLMQADSQQDLDVAVQEISFPQDVLSSDIPLSSQELDDLEMLMALEDSDV